MKNTKTTKMSKSTVGTGGMAPSNKAPKGPFVVVPGMVTPPIEVGIEMMAIDFSF